MSIGDEATNAAIHILEQRAREIDQISELMARILENITQRTDLIRENNRGINALLEYLKDGGNVDITPCHSDDAQLMDELMRSAKVPFVMIMDHKEDYMLLVSREQDREKLKNILGLFAVTKGIDSRGENNMNKFNIGEKYNKIGTMEPKAFIRWLMDNLSDNYRLILQNTLNNILEMISHYDNAQWAAEKKLHMPWDKTENMVEADHYMNKKQEFYEAKLSEVFKVLGMENEAYRNPDMITKAHALEKYINKVFEAAFEEHPVDKGSREYKEFLRKRAKCIDSIDIGKLPYGFKVNINNEDIEIAIISWEELDKKVALSKISEPYPFLLTDEEISANGIGYYVIDARNEDFKKLIATEKATSQVHRSTEKATQRQRTAKQVSVEHMVNDGYER